MDYPWYVEVSADASLTQGDLVESCPVLVFDEVPNLGNHQTAEALLAELDKAHAVQMVRAIVMTQACDLEHRNVRNVILCPIYNLDEYKRYWEEKRRQAGKSASAASWDGHIKQMKDGKIWNLTMLQKWDASGSGVLSIPHQVVDFHEVFSLPLDFLVPIPKVSDGITTVKTRGYGKSVAGSRGGRAAPERSRLAPLGAPRPPYGSLKVGGKPKTPIAWPGTSRAVNSNS